MLWLLLLLRWGCWGRPRKLGNKTCLCWSWRTLGLGRLGSIILCNHISPCSRRSNGRRTPRLHCIDSGFDSSKGDVQDRRRGFSTAAYHRCSFRPAASRSNMNKLCLPSKLAGKLLYQLTSFYQLGKRRNLEQYGRRRRSGLKLLPRCAGVCFFNTNKDRTIRAVAKATTALEALAGVQSIRQGDILNKWDEVLDELFVC